MKLAFFDSGIGGLTVLKEALDRLPAANYFYYADTANAPYGTKDKALVKEYIFQAVDFIMHQGIDGLVVACNTATSIAIKELRDRYRIPIIGMEPAVKPAVERNRQKKVLVTATPLTISEKKYRDLITKIDAKDIVDSLALPKLVEFAEEFIFTSDIVDSYLKTELTRYDLNEYSTLVLGCTHFSFYQENFTRLLPDEIDIIDGNYGTIRHLANTLKERGVEFTKSGRSEIEFYSSGQKSAVELERYLEILKQTEQT